MSITKNSPVMKLIENLSRIRVGEIALLKIERLANKMGVDEKKLMDLYIRTKNAALRKEFSRIPFSKRILLLPQCLRSQNCPAERTKFGYKCKRCGKCKIKSASIMAESLGYKGSFILSGGSVVKAIFAENKPKACVGVACTNELILGSFLTEKLGIITQCVQLVKDGCVETSVDWAELTKALSLSSHGSHI